MLTKTVGARVKAAGSADGLVEGQFKALVSVFGNVDSYGDMVMPGAFTDDLAAWQASGDPIPIYWSHQLSDPDMNLGSVVSAQETGDGLEVVGQLDLENPKAAQAYRLMKGRRVTQFSFSYDIQEAAWVERPNADGQGTNFDTYELRKLHVYEVGPCAIGANQSTDLLAVKTAGEHLAHIGAAIKAGRVLSAANETTLRTARDNAAGAVEAIDGVLSAMDSAGKTDDGKASTTAPDKDDEPQRAKSDDPTRFVTVDLSALQSMELAALAAG